jgi:N-acetylmuramoyl-L-alanine amidase
MVIVAALFLTMAAPALLAATAKAMYAAALEREQALHAAWQEAGDTPPGAAALKQARAIVAAYEALVRSYPTSSYCDNALWQAAGLAAEAFARGRQEADRKTAIRLYGLLAREYPTAALARKAPAELARLQAALETTAAPKASAPAARTPTTTAPKTQPPAPAPKAEAIPLPRPQPVEPAKTAKPAPSTDAPPPASAPAAGERPAPPTATIREIRRTVLTEVVRISIEFDQEVTYREERAENPARVFFDFSATNPAPSVQDASWTYRDDVVRQIRVARRADRATRVMIDLEGVSRYTVVALYAPYRLLIDCERKAASDTKAAEAKPVTEPASSVTDAPSLARTDAKTDAPSPADRNRVSMAHQLGLSIARIVIDPGHGGHDPGAEGGRLSEAQIVLDIALRLETLLTRQAGIEVVLTRRTDVFIPLDERPAIANRRQADLFLSIHANASKNAKAHGIESYYLNFAANPDAEAVAARENAGSGLTMKSLPDIVKAIALNNKLDESKDFAGMVQQSMMRRLRPSNKTVRDLGVKHAPFVVLVGATMPSVLAEVSFVTNRREGQLLNSEAYRQRIAEALVDAILRYRKNLKTADIVAHQFE